MKPSVALVFAVAAALAVSACSKTDQAVKPVQEPKKPEAIKKMELLAQPKAGDVFVGSKKAAEFPELEVKTEKPGEGEDTLQFGSVGSLHLIGRLASGREFKNTHESGAPEKVIMMEWGELQGLVLGAVGMKKGEVRTMRIPPDLAYGKAGAQNVPANATVFFSVQLVEIDKGGLDSGFVVRRTKEGSGPPIRAGQRGSFKYTGILADGDRAGEQFDTSEKPGGMPFTMSVGESGAIEGWLKGSLGMRVGEKRWLKIPPKMAYGPAGRDPIPENATLIFEMELVSIGG